MDGSMNKEYIERSAAIAALKDLAFQWDVEDLGVYETIEEVPAADVKPVIHGEWIPRHDYVYGGFDDFKCSVCGVYDMITRNPKWLGNYCPNCGAYMDGGNK